MWERGKKIRIIIMLVFSCLFFKTQPIYAYIAAYSLPALSGNQAADVANIAKSQLGYIGNGGTVYGNWWNSVTNWDVDYTYAGWCSMFVCWCADKAGAGLNVAYNKNGASPSYLFDFLKSNAVCDTSCSTQPQVGDFIFLGSSGNAEHVAVVTDYDANANRVYFVGGNQGNAPGGQVTASSCIWKYGAYWGSQIVLGYGRPNYKGMTSQEMTSGYPAVLPDGDYAIVNAANTDYFLDISGTGYNVDENVGMCGAITYDMNCLSEYDVWTIGYGDGFYTIHQKNAASYLAYDSSDNNVISFCGPGYFWAITPYDGFSYRIQSRFNSLAMDISGECVNAANVRLNSVNDSITQRWIVIPYKPEFGYSLEPKFTFNCNGGSIDKAYTTHKVDTVNGYRNEGYLAIYNIENKLVDTNIYGVEAAVNSDNKVIAIRPYGSSEQLTVPQGGYVLSGHVSKDAANGASFTSALQIGDYVFYDKANRMVSAYHDYQSFINVKKQYSSQELPIPTRQGYEFKGWYTDPVGGTRVFSSEGLMNKQEIFAHWEAQYPEEPDVTGIVSKERVEVRWNRTQNTTHYNLWIMKIEDGESFTYSGQKNVTSPYVQTLPEGDYFVQVEACNSNGEGDGFCTSSTLYIEIRLEPSITMQLTGDKLRVDVSHKEKILEHGIVYGQYSGVDLDTAGRIKIAYSGYDSLNAYTFEVNGKDINYYKAYAIWMNGSKREVMYSKEINPSAYTNDSMWSDWSEWSTESIEASENVKVQTKIQYSYSNKLTKTSYLPFESGWERYGTPEFVGYNGIWNGWSDTYPSGDDKDIQTRTVYRYHTYICPVCGDREEWNGLSNGSHANMTEANYQETWSTVPYSQANYGSPSYSSPMRYTTSLGDGQKWWFTLDNVNDTAPGTQCSFASGNSGKWPGGTVIKTQYNYRTKIYKYSFYKWSDWSEWTDTEYVKTENRDVKTRTVYSCSRRID